MMYLKNNGFTLIELMVTIAVAAIILSIGMPAMENFIKDKNLTAQTNDFIAATRAARGEAIKRRTTIDLEPSGANWSDGWEIQDATNAVIKHMNGIQGVTLGAASANILSFSASGIRTNIAGDFTVRFCDSRGKGRLITLTGLGGVSTVCYVGYGAAAPEACSPDPGC